MLRLWNVIRGMASDALLSLSVRIAPRPVQSILAKHVVAYLKETIDLIKPKGGKS